MSKTRGLGKGIDSLFISTVDDSLLNEDKTRIKNVSIAEIHPNPDQPRKQFDELQLHELANSIKRHGVLQPILVTMKGKGYQIVAGERRFRAAGIAGLTEIPAIVRSMEELEQLEVAIVENMQRVDLSVLDQAASMYRLHTQFNIEYKDIAARLAKSSATVSNIVRLLQLPKEAATALQDNKISEGHARAILALEPDTSAQSQLLAMIISKGLTVRQAEQYVNETKRSKQHKQSTAVKKIGLFEDEQLSRSIKLPVYIKNKRTGGELIIRFTSAEELERLKKRLAK